MVDAAVCVKVAFSDYVAQAPARSFSWKYLLFFRPGGLGYPLVVGVAAALSIGILSIAGQSRAMRIVGVATRLFIAALSSWIVVEYAYYVVAPWLPLALILVARFALLVLQDGSRSERGAIAWSVALGLSAVLALPSVGVAQSLLGWVGFRGGVSWDAADAAVGRMMSVLGDRPIGLDRTLALLPRESERAIAFTHENGRVRYHSRDGQIRKIDGDAPPVALIRGYCEPLRVDGYSTVCLPWREPGPSLHRWVDSARFGWAFTLLVRDDAGIDVSPLVNDMMCAAGDAAKPGSCRPR